MCVCATYARLPVHTASDRTASLLRDAPGPLSWIWSGERYRTLLSILLTRWLGGSTCARKWLCDLSLIRAMVWCESNVCSWSCNAHILLQGRVRLGLAAVDSMRALGLVQLVSLVRFLRNRRAEPLVTCGRGGKSLRRLVGCGGRAESPRVCYASGDTSR